MNSDDMLQRYKLAERLMATTMASEDAVIRNDAVFSYWIENSTCFWYLKSTKQDKQFRIVDAAAATNNEVFSYRTLADSLSGILKTPIDHQLFRIDDITVSLSDCHIQFTAFEKEWSFDYQNNICKEVENHAQPTSSMYGYDPVFCPLSTRWLKVKDGRFFSPDGSKAVFCRDHNIWLECNELNEQVQLTHDGAENNFYRGSGFTTSEDKFSSALWSPDSQRLLMARWDTRDAASRAMLEVLPQDGNLDLLRHEIKGLAISGSENVETCHLYSIDLATKEIVPVDYPALIGHYTTGMANHFRAKMVWWAQDSRHAFFIDLSRDGKTANIVKWDTHTRKTEILIEETSDIYVRLHHTMNEPPAILPLPDSNELIWFSERTGWSHLYLYDLNNGELKQAITTGNWLVRDILHFDASRRELIIQTAGRNPDINPYYKDICKVNIDTGELVPLASDNFHYLCYRYLEEYTSTLTPIGLLPNGVRHTISPCGQYIVSVRSRVDTLPETILIDRDGREILCIETADDSGLPENWSWPEPVKLMAADGKTDIYAVVFRLPGFNPEHSYPIVEFSSTSRETSVLPQGSFGNCEFNGHGYYNACALAALGFICVIIEGRGTPCRHKSFSLHHYGNHRYTGDFDDLMAGICQLAERYPAMDINRVGIMSSENMTNAIFSLKHSDFYKVAVHHNLYDSRYGNACFHEMPEGMFNNPLKDVPENDVDSFNGKMLLIQGLSSHMTGGTSRLVEALENANKDFDMLALPRLAQDMADYPIRRGYDYLVRHLQGVEPPKEFRFNGLGTAGQRKVKNIMKLEEKIEGIFQSENSSTGHAVKHE